MRRILFILLLVNLTPSVVNAAGVKPNVVFVFADDMGYGEIEALNPDHSKIPTPNLNQLAVEGCVFTDAHSTSSVCSPTRYSLLTGRYNWRTRLQKGVLTGDDEPLIAAGRLTLGKLFQQQGYKTAIFGKWHLNYNYEVPADLEHLAKPIKTKQRLTAPFPIGTHVPDGPLTRGFDHYYGFHHARTMSSFVRDDQIVDEIDVVDALPTLTRAVVEYIDQHAEAARLGQPFFLYYPMSSPHAPIVPAEAWQGKGKIGTYADFVAQTDGSVGEVMQAINRNGLASNTIFIFSSDNGTSKVAKIQQLEAQGHYPSGRLRGSKADLWDGGHRIPFIVRWPGHIEPQSHSDQLVCLSDWMATFADMFSVEITDNFAEDSISFLPALSSQPVPNPRTSIIHHSIDGKFAIRQDEWKLLLSPGSGGWSAPKDRAAIERGLPETQLYNLDNDLGEQSNLVAAHPSKVKELIQLLKEMVANGRSTPGTVQSNDVDIDIWKRSTLRD